MSLSKYAREKGFDGDRHLANEAETSIANDGIIDSKEANFMVQMFERYGRRNIKIRKKQLIQLGRAFGLNYSKLYKIGPRLEKLIRNRANITNKSRHQQANLSHSLGPVPKIPSPFPSSAYQSDRTYDQKNPWELQLPQAQAELPKSHQELIDKTPKPFQQMMREFLSKTTANTQKTIRNIEVSDMPLIFLSDTKLNQGCAYINGRFETFPILDNDTKSMKGSVVEFNKMIIADKPTTAASNGPQSATVLGAAFIGDNLGARWTHGVDFRRLAPKKKTRGCIGIDTRLIRKMAMEVTPYATKYGIKETRIGETNKNGWSSQTGKVQRYKLNKPMFNYIK